MKTNDSLTVPQMGIGTYLVKPSNTREMERMMAIAMARFADLMELRRINTELHVALANGKPFSGLLRICCSCKKIWNKKVIGIKSDPLSETIPRWNRFFIGCELRHRRGFNRRYENEVF